jgi:uncharacterized MAPEG superfamily protein
MTSELTYLFLTAVLLACAWIPHIVGQVMTQGLLNATDYRELREQSSFPAWVRRANRAHVNLVEQFGAFAALVLIAHVLEVSTATTVASAAVFFWARIVHFIIMLSGIGIAMIRTLVFVTAWASLMVFAWALWQGLA